MPSTSTGHVVNRLRELCLAFPETSERASWGHPNFRAGKRTFAAFEVVSKRPSIALRLEPSAVESLLTRKGFFVTPYGRGQWVSLWADGALDWRLIGRLLEKSYRVVAIKRMIAAFDADHQRMLASSFPGGVISVPHRVFAVVAGRRVSR